MKKVLFITPYNPFAAPLGAASKGVRYRIENLSRMAEVHLLTFVNQREKAVVIPNHLNIKYNALYYPLAKKKPQRKWHRFFKTILGQLDIFDNIGTLSGAFQKNIKDVMSQNKYDLVHIDDIIIAPVMKHCPIEVKKLLFFHNLLTLQYKNIYRAKTNSTKKTMAFIEYLHVKRFEKTILQQIETAVVLTEIERMAALRISPKTKIHQIPLEVSLNEYNIPAKKMIDPRRITFTGTMGYEPNREGAIYFIKKIFPLILKKCPDASFYVVGMNPSQDLKDLGNDRIVVTGKVPGIFEHINRAAVIVVPILSGGGMRFKILESFALAKAVVSTSIGAEGIHCEHEKNILIADNADLFARQVCFLLGNLPRAQKIGEHARELIASEYENGVVWQRWQRVYDEFIGPRVR